MVRSSKGFTIIELAIVMSIVGILAALLIPKFYNMATPAKQNTVQAIADALTSASSANYMLSKAGSSKAITINNCTSVSNALPKSTSLPTGYTITAAAIAVGASVVCTLTYPGGGITATFIGIGT